MIGNCDGVVRRLEGYHPGGAAVDALFSYVESPNECYRLISRLVDTAKRRQEAPAIQRDFQAEASALGGALNMGMATLEHVDAFRGGVDTARFLIALNEFIGGMRSLSFVLYNIREYHQYRGFGYPKWERFCSEELGCSHHKVNNWIRSHMEWDAAPEDLFSTPAGGIEAGEDEGDDA